MNTELSNTLVSLMKYVANNARPQAACDLYDQTKLQNLRKVKGQIDAQSKRVNEQSKIIIPAIKATDKKPTTKVFLEEDVIRMNSHKELMMDWLFTEMEEHSKKLQMYSDWFDYFQRGISVEKEFTNIMAMTGITQLNDSSEFLQAKKREKQAGSRGNDFRQGNGAARSQSQTPAGQQ